MKKTKFIILSLTIALSFLLAACFSGWAEEEPSKGAIILNLGGVSVPSRAAATMGDIDYTITLFNANNHADNGTDYGPLRAGALIKITVNPGYYKIRVAAYLNGAFYARGETDPAVPVQVIAGSTTTVPILLAVDLHSYLTAPVFSSANVIDLPLAVTLSSSKWNEILSAIDSESKNVNLDLSQCKRSTDTSGGGLYSNGTFDPDFSNPTGKNLIKSLILPDAATAIQAGTAGGNATFNDFTSMSAIDTGNGIQTIGDYAFCNLNPCLANVTLGSNVTTIGQYAFIYCSFLNGIIFPDSLTEIGTGAFQACASLYNESIIIPPNRNGTPVTVKTDAFPEPRRVVIPDDAILESNAFETGNSYLVEIKIGSGVVLDPNAIQAPGSFYTEYSTNGSGTYTWDGTAWNRM